MASLIVIIIIINHHQHYPRNNYHCHLDSSAPRHCCRSPLLYSSRPGQPWQCQVCVKKTCQTKKQTNKQTNKLKTYFCLDSFLRVISWIYTLASFFLLFFISKLRNWKSQSGKISFIYLFHSPKWTMHKGRTHVPKGKKAPNAKDDDALGFIFCRMKFG